MKGEETHWHWKLPDGDRERDPTCLELGLDGNDGRMASIVEIGRRIKGDNLKTAR